MPVKKCTSDGKSGYKYGDSGHCYTGPGARQKAIKQGQAIEIQKHSGASLLDQVLIALRVSVEAVEEDHS